MGEPSAEYVRALEACKQHHATSKTFSGKLLRPHAPFIKEIIDRLGCQSVLDFGVGKGVQYEWISHGDDASIPKGMTIEQYWGVPVTKYDPAYPPFAAEPTGTFDLVLCTHTLGSIPKIDLSWVIGRLYGYANKGLYIAEKIGDVKKAVITNPDGFPRRWKHHDWKRALKRDSAIEVTLATRSVDPHRGVIVRREVINEACA